MTAKTREMKLKLVVKSSAVEVYSAFTNATALCEWLCNVAQSDSHVGGRIYLWWNGGYYTSGEYLVLKPGEKIVFSWHGRDDPDATRVRINIKPEKDGVRINLTHIDLGSGKEWNRTYKEIKRGWVQGLENLKSVLETGRDLRFLRQPLIGLNGLEEVTAETASRLGLGIEEGLRIEGVVEGMGAALAGLQKDDVLYKISGRKIDNLASLMNSLQGVRAGEKVKVIYYRNGKRKSTNLTLSHRSVPDVPETAEKLAGATKKIYEQIAAGLDESLAGVSEEEASYNPGLDEWNVKEVLAHLIANERETHSWFASLIEGQEADFMFHANLPARIAATVIAFPTLASLVEELKRCQAETAAMISVLPAEFVSRKRSYWRLGYNLLEMPSHYQSHLAQIRTAVEDYRRRYAPQVVESHRIEESVEESTENGLIETN